MIHLCICDAGASPLPPPASLQYNNTHNNNNDSGGYDEINTTIHQQKRQEELLSARRDRWNSLLQMIPEESERNKILQYKPQNGIEIYNHYNPKSFLMGRLLLRKMIEKYYFHGVGNGSAGNFCPPQQQQQSFVKYLERKESSDPQNTHPLVSIPRTFEGRPCVEPNTDNDDHDDDSSSSALFYENIPSINLSHNNGVVAVGILPNNNFSGYYYSENDNDENPNNNKNKIPSFVIGVDVMCIDSVPTALFKGLKQEFTNEKLEETLSLLEPYMTDKEWEWINRGDKIKNSEDEIKKRMKEKDFIRKYFVKSFEKRREKVLKNMMMPLVTDDKKEMKAACSADDDDEEDNYQFPLNNILRLWRFLVLWTIKEAVLKAAGIGLGFDTTNIEVSFQQQDDNNTIDVDDPSFYNNSIKFDTKEKEEEEFAPLNHVKISVTVPKGVKPSLSKDRGDNNQNQHHHFFKTWLFFDKESVSTTAVVLAPAFVSNWSTHSKYAIRKNVVTRKVQNLFSSLCVDKKQKRQMTEEEQDRLLDECEDEYWRGVVAEFNTQMMRMKWESFRLKLSCW